MDKTYIDQIKTPAEILKILDKYHVIYVADEIIEQGEPAGWLNLKIIDSYGNEFEENILYNDTDEPLKKRLLEAFEGSYIKERTQDYKEIKRTIRRIKRKLKRIK